MRQGRPGATPSTSRNGAAEGAPRPPNWKPLAAAETGCGFSKWRDLKLGRKLTTDPTTDLYLEIFRHFSRSVLPHQSWELKAALWAPTFWAVSFCHFSPWIYPSRKNMAALVTSTLHLPQANPKNKIPYTLNSITENRKNQKKQKTKKTKIPEKGWGAHSCWIFVFFVFFRFFLFFFFGFCVFLVVLLIVPPVYRGGFTLKMFSPLLPVSPSHCRGMKPALLLATFTLS